MKRGRMNFSVNIQPIYRLGDNPTLAFARTLDLIERLDDLGYDEAWIGEHQTLGWELISSPEIILAAAAERTKHIRLGSGVTGLSYHHPLMLVNRFILLDHVTRGRVMLGCGPGGLPSDAYIMGIEVQSQRKRLDEALDAITRLLKGDEPVSMKTDWFELREALPHLAPYQETLPVYVASVLTPSGMRVAGKYGLGVLSLISDQSKLSDQWDIAEETAKSFGTTVSRDKWRLAVTMHTAETDELALKEITKGAGIEFSEYWEKTAGRARESGSPIRDAVGQGTMLIGSPETVAEGIRQLQANVRGGFGGIMFRQHEWATAEQTTRSFELFARWVMPQFQGGLDAPRMANSWAIANRAALFAPNVEAVRGAFKDAGREAPISLRSKMMGGEYDQPTAHAG